MQRDLKLIKQILRYVEKKDIGGGGFLFHPDIEGYSSEQVEGHVKLCGDAGFIELNSQGHAIRLTWQGHDMLEHLKLDQ